MRVTSSIALSFYLFILILEGCWGLPSKKDGSVAEDILTLVSTSVNIQDQNLKISSQNQDQMSKTSSYRKIFPRILST